MNYFNCQPPRGHSSLKAPICFTATLRCPDILNSRNLGPPITLSVLDTTRGVSRIPNVNLLSVQIYSFLFNKSVPRETSIFMWIRGPPPAAPPGCWGLLSLEGGSGELLGCWCVKLHTTGSFSHRQTCHYQIFRVSGVDYASMALMLRIAKRTAIEDFAPRASKMQAWCSFSHRQTHPLSRNSPLERPKCKGGAHLFRTCVPWWVCLPLTVAEKPSKITLDRLGSAWNFVRVKSGPKGI